MAKNKKDVTPHYELLYIISNKYTEEEVGPIAEKIEKIIGENGGEINYKENWGKKKLAYPIKHFNHGYYLLLEFDLKGNGVNDANRELKMMDEVLRHQIIARKKRSPEEIEADIKIEAKQREHSNRKDQNEPEEEVKKEEAKEKEETKKEEEKVDLKKLDEKLDKILDTDDLL